MFRVRELRELGVDPRMFGDHVLAERADFRRTASRRRQLAEVDFSGSDARRRQHELLIGGRDFGARLH